jgi:transposase
MDKRFLEDCLAKGMSLDAIGTAVDRHPSTVSYWLKKRGLVAVGRAEHAPKGSIDLERLRTLLDKGMSIRSVAEELDAGYSTVRYWIRRLGIETDRMTRGRESAMAKQAGLRKAYLRCPRHGHTTFFARSEGGFRCAKCSTAAVSERRRAVKRLLVEEAGGSCAICGFSGHPAALQFHHRDPTQKEFHLGQKGHSRSLDRMRAEAKKCVLLCATCHALVEAGVREVPPPDR